MISFPPGTIAAASAALQLNETLTTTRYEAEQHRRFTILKKIVYDFFFSHSIFFPLLAAVGESSVNVFSYKRHNYAVVVFSPSTKLHSSSKENCFFFYCKRFFASLFFVYM